MTIIESTSDVELDDTAHVEANADVPVEEILVEEISIDGMCGVY